MRIDNTYVDYQIYVQQQQKIKQELRPIEPVSQINPTLSIPDSAYLEAMQVLGTIIDIKV